MREKHYLSRVLRRFLLVLIAGLVFVMSVLAVYGPVDLFAPEKEKNVDEKVGEEISLPSPLKEGEVPLETAFSQRKSRRSFDEKPLSLREIGQLLWAGQGIAVDGTTGATRTAPSAGGTHPLEIYLVTGNFEELPGGVYRYNAKKHTLIKAVKGDRRNELSEAALGQEFVAVAPAILVVSAHYERTESAYGDRAERYVKMEVGHAGQNICLQAETLGLASVVVGAFEDSEVGKILNTEASPLAVIPVGHPN